MTFFLSVGLEMVRQIGTQFTFLHMEGSLALQEELKIS